MQLTAEFAIDVLQAAFVVLASIVAIRTFSRDSNLKRAEWLERLHDKFYLGKDYKTIRRILDYESADNFQEFKNKITSKSYSDEQEQLVDYLNFFHFIATIWLQGQIKEVEIKRLFSYYLSVLTKRDFLVAYMKEEEFHDLLKMLRKFGYLKKGR